jgi:MinD-like ATPase involved in chromosome partitioning or flagellar assembly
VYPGPLVDGLPPKEGVGARLARQFQRALTTKAERAEAELEGRIRAQAGVTRPNLIAVASATGGVGKSTAAFVIGNLLASHLNLRVVAVDANPHGGTLGRLPPDHRRSDRSLVELLEEADRLRTAAEVNAYVSRLTTGLHVLGGASAGDTPLAPDRYGELVAFLDCFYEVVLLDLATGMNEPATRFALDRADQTVVVTTGGWMAAELLMRALPELDRLTLVVNRSRPDIDQRLAERAAIAIPRDPQLETMLDAGCYALDALSRPARLAIKRLGLAVAAKLV